MKRIAMMGTILALSTAGAGCGAQQSIERAATSARHVVEEGQKTKKQLEVTKAKLEKDARELVREGKAAKAAIEREARKIAG